ncbi:MAG: hypothetical protein ACKOCM_00560 [Cyanobacteriota bacterium]
MRKSLALAAAIGLTLLGGSAVRAQLGGDLQRATNLARMTAEKINGGLNRYFAANCMHSRDGGSCLIGSSAQGFSFRFLGGPPGWEVYHQAATVETQILVAPSGTQVVQVHYNGPPRGN